MKLYLHKKEIPNLRLILSLISNYVKFLIFNYYEMIVLFLNNICKYKIYRTNKIITILLNHISLALKSFKKEILHKGFPIL